MQDHLANHARDWLTFLLAGLGITFAFYGWFGGVFMALCGASIARYPETDFLNSPHFEMERV